MQLGNTIRDKKQLLLFKIINYPREDLFDYYYYDDVNVLSILKSFNQSFHSNFNIYRAYELKGHIGTYYEIPKICLELWGWEKDENGYETAKEFWNIYIQLFDYEEMISDS